MIYTPFNNDYFLFSIVKFSCVIITFSHYFFIAAECSSVLQETPRQE